MFLARSIAVIMIALLLGCTDRTRTSLDPDVLEIGRPYQVFAASSRRKEDDGSYGFGRSETLSHLEFTVSIPPEHSPGTLNFGYGNPNPQNQFAVADRREFTSPAAFQDRIREQLSKYSSDQREVTVFIHGYNSTQLEVAYRSAQMAFDTQIPGAFVFYSWPSRGSALAYAYDTDSVLYARDGLEQLLKQLSGISAKRVLVVAHSIGSALTMETLRQIDINSPGWIKRHLSGVVLISPDLDVEVFRSQINRLSQVPQPFVLFVSQKDRVLNLSAALRGTLQQQRLGNIASLDLISDLPVEIVDTTSFSDEAGSGHFIPATSPALIALLRDSQSVSDTLGEERITLTSVISGRPETGLGDGLIRVDELR